MFVGNIHHGDRGGKIKERQQATLKNIKNKRVGNSERFSHQGRKGRPEGRLCHGLRSSHQEKKEGHGPHLHAGLKKKND